MSGPDEETQHPDSAREDTLSSPQSRRHWWIAVGAIYVAVAVFGPLWLFTEALILGASLGLAIWSMQRFASSLGLVWRCLVAPLAFLAWAVLIRLLWLTMVDHLLVV